MELKNWIEEVRSKKKKLEERILGLIKNFEEDTGVKVSYIEMGRLPVNPERPDGRYLKIDVDIEI